MDSLRVFVSSTFRELEDYRAAVTRAIIAGGDLPEDMLYWSAIEEPPLAESLRRVRASNLVILVLGHAYGHIPQGNTVSITELEFDEAVTCRIPTLAFRVDAEHPWSPKWIERDAARTELFERFVRKVASTVTFRHFTSPESLEVAITQAIGGFRFRRATPGSGTTADAVSVHASERLDYVPDCNVRVGTAPDGAPWLLEVRRSKDYESGIQFLADAAGLDSGDPILWRLRGDLAQHVKGTALTKQVHAVQVGDKMLSCLVARGTMSDLFAPSLLEGLMVAAGGYQLDATGRRAREVSSTPASRTTGLESERGRDPRVQSVGGANRFLAVPLDSTHPPFSGGWVGSGRERSFQPWRAFIEESMLAFDGTGYAIYVQDRKQEWDLTWAPAADFIARWAEILQHRQKQSFAYHSLLTIPRASILQFVLSVIDAVEKMHSSGRIHGDVKPSNILALASGAYLIDEVGLTPGERSPLVTVGWSPPEQICRRAVSFSADVYALGILLLRLVGGQQLGRLLNFRLPDGVDATTIEDPAVYVAPESVVLREADRASWLAVIEKALRTDPNERYVSAGELGSAVRQAMNGGPLGGHVNLTPPWGERPVLARSSQGNPYIAWPLDGS